MMSGDERENDKQTEQSGEAQKQDEVLGTSDATEKSALSAQSEKKSYPFSVPGDEKTPADESIPASQSDDLTSAGEEALSDEQESGTQDATSISEAVETAPEAEATDVEAEAADLDEAPAVEDIVRALEPEDTQSQAPEVETHEEPLQPSIQSESISEESVSSGADLEGQTEEDIEAELDEGLFSNEVLPDEGIEEATEEVAAQQQTDEQEPSLEIDTDRQDDEASTVPEAEAEEHHQTDGERLEPYMAQRTSDQGATPQTSGELDGDRGEAQSDGPRHAFDTGEPVVSEEALSQQEKKKSGFGVVLVSFIIMLLLVGVVVGGGFFYVKLKFDAPGSQPQQLSHVIKPKQGLKEIASDLADKGIIEDKNIFMIGSYISGQNKSLKAGEFEFAPNSSMKEVLETIAKGKVIQHKITLAEGLTSQQIVEIINDNPVLTGEIDTLPAEGSLLPETYQFTRGMTRQQIIGRMQKAQTELVEKLWPVRADNLGVVTPADAVTLASIVEKETGLSNERARVAAVFNNRLNKNMRLQSDPTVIYGIVGGEGKLDRPITRSDLDEQTAYNTYKIDGLPPTPIANPGKASIEAVLRPAQTNDLFFVADGTGGHAFATTLKEHNENVARWRKIEKGVEAPQPPAAEKAKSELDEKAKKAVTKKIVPPKPVESVKDKVKEKAAALQKTVTPKNDAKSIARIPEKTDKVLPKAKPQIAAPEAVTDAAEKKESLTEKVRAIFVKPEEAPLPRSKPNALLQQGNDKINVTPLPEQNVPTTPRVTVPPVNTQQNVPQSVQQSVPQTLQQSTQPGGEPTPELEGNRPSNAPVQRPFNPFED